MTHTTHIQQTATNKTTTNKAVTNQIIPKFLLGSFLVAMGALSSYVQATESSPQNNEHLQAALQQKVSQAISKLEQTNRKSWSYKVTRYENEEGDITSSIEQFTPAETIDNQWDLLQLNGESPTEKQIKKFIKTKKEQKKDRDEKKGTNQGYSVKLRELINPESLALISENNNYIDMGFNVTISKLGKDAIGKLQGVLSYNKNLDYIETITITNNAEFSPIFSAKISDFKLKLTFTNINQSVLPQQNEMEMKGTFAFFTEINEVSNDTYSEYSFKEGNTAE